MAEQRLARAILFADESAGRFASEASGIRRRQAELVAGLIADTAAQEGARADSVQNDALAYAINGFNEALARWWAEHPEIEPEAIAGWASELLLGGLEHAAAQRRVGRRGAASATGCARQIGEKPGARGSETPKAKPGRRGE